MSRIPLDAYQTPLALCTAIVKHLEPVLPKFLPIYEPCCGEGNWLRALRSIGCRSLLASDINPEARGLQLVPEANSHARDARILCKDFVHTNWAPAVIIGNPPYLEAEDHLQHYLSVKPALCIQLLRISFLAGQARYQSFWKKYPPTSLIVLPKRPSFTGGKTDVTDYAVYIWAEKPIPLPPISWLVA